MYTFLNATYQNFKMIYRMTWSVQSRHKSIKLQVEDQRFFSKKPLKRACTLYKPFLRELYKKNWKSDFCIFSKIFRNFNSKFDHPKLIFRKNDIDESVFILSSWNLKSFAPK